MLKCGPDNGSRTLVTRQSPFFDWILLLSSKFREPSTLQKDSSEVCTFLFWLVRHLWALCNVSFRTWYLMSFLKINLIQYLCMWLHLHWIQFYIGTWNFLLYLCNYCCYHSCVSVQIQYHELHIHLCCCNSGQSQ